MFESRGDAAGSTVKARERWCLAGVLASVKSKLAGETPALPGWAAA
jgi:hypothetical protein